MITALVKFLDRHSTTGSRVRSQGSQGSQGVRVRHRFIGLFMKRAMIERMHGSNTEGGFGGILVPRHREGQQPTEAVHGFGGA